MTVHWFYRDLYADDCGPDVNVVAIKLGSTARCMEPDLIARVRGFQRTHGLPITGVVDHATAGALGETAAYTDQLVPLWYQGSLIDETGLRQALRIAVWADLPDAIRRFQSAHGHYPTGELDQRLAIEIGD